MPVGTVHPVANFLPKWHLGGGHCSLLGARSKPPCPPYFGKKSPTLANFPLAIASGLWFGPKLRSTMRPPAHPLGAHPLGAAGSWGANLCFEGLSWSSPRFWPRCSALKGMKGVLIQCWFDCARSARVGGVWPGPHKCGWCGATGPPVEGVGSGARGTTRGCLFFGVCVLPIPYKGT